MTFLKFSGITRQWCSARCDIVCPRDNECTLHFKLNGMEQFAECVSDKNLNFNKVVKKMAFVFNKDYAQPQEAFWWNNIFE